MPAAIPAIAAFVTSKAVVTAMIVGAVGGLASGGGIKGALKGALFGAVTGGIAAGISGIANAAGAASGAAGGSAGASAATSVATNIAGQIVNGVGSSDSAPDSYGWLSGNPSGVDDLALSLTGSPSAGDGVGLQDVTQAPTAVNPNPDINMRLPGAGDPPTQVQTAPVADPAAQQSTLPVEGRETGSGVLGSVMGATNQVGRWVRENPDAAKILGGGLSAVMQQRAVAGQAERQRRYQLEDRERLENNARWVYTGAK